MIRSNGDRYCKNPYFLHSLSTTNGPRTAYTEKGSLYGGPSQAFGDNRTIKSRKTLASQGVYDQEAVGPPRLKKKKIRPFSAPRHQGLRSVGLKNKVVNQQNQVMQSYNRPGTTDIYGQQMMETVNEQNNNQQFFEQEQDMDEGDEEQIYQRGMDDEEDMMDNGEEE